MLPPVVNFSTLISLQSAVQKLNRNGVTHEVYKKNASDKTAVLSDLQQFLFKLISLSV